METLHFLSFLSPFLTTLANSIFTNISNMEQQKATEKSEQIFVRNHIIIYEVLRKDISFCSFIIYSSVLFFYPFSLLFSLLHTMPSHLMIVFLAPVFLFNAAVRLCNFVVIFIEFSECQFFSLSGFVISLMPANYMPTLFMRIIWPLLKFPIYFPLVKHRRWKCLGCVEHRLWSTIDMPCIQTVRLLLLLFCSVRFKFILNAATIFQWCNYNLFTFETKWLRAARLQYKILMLSLLFPSLLSAFIYLYKIHFMLHHQNCIRINNGRNRQAKQQQLNRHNSVK